MSALRDRLKSMLLLQDSMNAKVNPAWLTARYPWLRAVLLEGAEAIDHYGWKWWKHTKPDMEQFRVELVDIWHFALSDALERECGNHDVAASTIEQALTAGTQVSGMMFGVKFYTFAEMAPIERVELMVGLAAQRRFSFALFAAIMDDAGMDWNQLYVGYVSKNVLNFFRQDNGYKEGTYIKMWVGREDNEWMTEIVKKLDSTADNFDNLLYNELAMSYIGVLEFNGRMTESERLRQAFRPI